MFRKSLNDTSLKPLKRLGEMLIDDDIISQGQLKKALEHQRESGGFLGQILIEQKSVSQDTLISYLAKQCQIPHLSLLNYRIGKEALAQVPRELCLKHYLVPVDKMGRILTLAMVDPLDTEALEEIKKHCPDLRIKPVLCSWEHFQTTVKQVYAHEVQKPKNLEEKYAKFDELSHAQALREEDEDSSSSFSAEDEATFDNSPSISKIPVPVEEDASEDSESDEQLSATLLAPGLAADVQTIATAMRESICAAFADMAARPDSKSGNDSISRTLFVPQADIVKDAQDTLNAIEKNSKTQERLLTKISETMLQYSEVGKQSQKEKQDHIATIAGAVLESVQQTARLMETYGANAPQQPATRSQAMDWAAPGDVADEDVVAHCLENFCFDNFVSGEENRFTMKLARAVAKSAGSEYNPLFVYGKPGLGKTHLISAIGNAYDALGVSQTDDGQGRTGYITAGRFAQAFGKAIADNALDPFRFACSRWGVLIVDDIQVLGGRVESQEEFFRLFELLQQRGCQLIIAGDKAPDGLEMVEQRLVSRFSSGIVAELKPPELNTRMTILRQYAEKEEIELPEDLLTLVATEVPDDIRKMTGALRKIIVFSRLESTIPTVEDAQKILTHLQDRKSA